MPHIIKIFTCFFVSLLLSTSVRAESNIKSGEELHQNHCIKCHDTSIYTRTPRRVNSLPQLGKQVRFCKDNLGMTWFDDEVNDVIHYLNTTYYQF